MADIRAEPKGGWQWLQDIFKKMVYAMSPEELEASYHQALQDPAVLKHQRMKAYNVTQLVNLICTRLEAYYIRRLLNVANGRTEAGVQSIYLVNLSMGMCSCPAGSNGALCKHQHSVMQAFKLQEGHHLPVASFTAKKSFYEMATGTQEQAGTTTPPTPQDGSGAEEASSQSELVAEHLKGHLRSMFDDLVDKLEKDETFQAPIESLVSSYEKIHTDSGLISALSTFGKMRSAAARNIKMQPRKGLQISTQIGVQPTAFARRKTPLGGRQALITGRPPKRAWREHNYGKDNCSVLENSQVHIFITKLPKQQG
ncbi:hypothetical protein N1851_025733 [Merluccius polli]|uniref:SWIM-type domain-containing protein n=1 Tax=Merluccius polli TaxID=89951 RepID=A0AA47MDD4_MERPO|nr:hypothetical protein N1851_025733 [Merluccius polli]